MGKGDKKTFRGKLSSHSYGNKRKKKKKKRNLKIKVKSDRINMSGQIFHEKGKSAEDFVHRLSGKAYLKYWCFPNPIDEDGDKKEICDLIISFFDTILLVSVKNYSVKGNYQRYKNKVVVKSSNQIFGAERKIFKSSRIIKITHPERGVIELNPQSYNNIFRITINLGEQFEHYELVDIDNKRGSVSILNAATFEAIIDELDTIKDLIEYLKVRNELLLASNNKLLKCTESDILAYYLMDNRTFPEEFYSPDFENDSLKLKGKWQNYIANKSVILKKIYDSSSYFIDELIKNDVLKIPNGELLAKELMTLSRFERRNIANNLFELVRKYEGVPDCFARRRFLYNEMMFLFVFYPKNQKEIEVDEMLKLTQEIYAYKFNQKKVLLLAATDKLTQWKFGLFESFGNDKITDAVKKRLDNIIESFGWFKEEIKIEMETKEYPDE